MANGFFYSVKAIVDKASFEQGRSELAKLEQTSKKLIVGIAGAATALTGMATIAGNVAQQEMKVAHSVGMSTTALASWKTACNIAGASANGLISALGSLETKMQHLKTGQVDTGLAKNLGMLGIGYGDFAEMDSESRMRTVFNSAGQMEDQRLAAVLIGDTLGPAAKEYYESLKLSGKSLEQQLREAKQLNFVSEQNRKEAAIFAAEFNSVKEAGKSITMLIGSEIGSALTPTVRKLKNYLIENKNAIVKGITGVVSQVSGIFKGIAGAIEKVAPYVQGLIDKFGGLDQVIVKVGIGFAALKLTQFAGGIAGIISSVNLLKAALTGIGTGLLAGGIFLILEDIFGYFRGADSVTEDVLLWLDEMKKKFDIHIDTEQFKELAAELKKMWENTENFRKAFAEIMGEVFMQGLKAITDGINALSASVTFALQLFNAFKEGGFTGGVEFIMQAIKESEGDGPVAEHLNNTGKIAGYIMNPQNILRDLGIKLYGKLKADDEIEDGIISPNGKVTKVSPNDWVFAAKNVSDLASGFIPNNINSSTSNSVIVNQTFNVESQDMAQTVKVSAFNGVQDALKNAYKQSSSFIQQMPGVR